MTDRYVCIHGHFYQPPRENPWLEAIELQDSAAPYHDWNERITAESYEPNARSRILDDDGRLRDVVNNYARMSFNFGPTLLAWMEHAAPDVYAAVLRADRESRERFSGHGSALAQAYNHMILPLANERDRRTQVEWGIRDFEHRFGREPEGMWLPETGADTASLETLAGAGIRFTILAPRQARRVRPMGGRKWTDVDEDSIDTTVPYRVKLPSGRTIDVFFYDGPTSKAVAFEQLLVDGHRFADRLLGSFPDEADGARLVHVATDGETYGHHHRHGDMALAFALDQIDHHVDEVELTNYGEFLERRPPEHEAEIVEDSSWSCIHGVERWRSDCGCNSGRGWHQRWREPLRQSLDELRDRIEPVYADRAGKLLDDPWAARDDYIDVVLDRSPGRVLAFIERHSSRPLDEGERVTTLKLLEMQRHAMLMYTSCGWFFDELSGIETVQVLQYAARAIQLAEDVGGERFEPAFLDRLATAESNVVAGGGRDVFERHVRPATVDLTKVAAHYAAISLFEPTADQPASAQPAPLFEGYGVDAPRVYCYEIEPEDYRLEEAGRARIALGRVRVTSMVTREWHDVSFGALHFGDHNLNAAARAFLGGKAYRAMVDDVTEAFSNADLPEVVRRLDRHFGSSPFSLRTLFRDEQRKVLDEILGAWVDEAEADYRSLHERQAPLIRFLAGLGAPLPAAFRANAELVVDAELLRQFESRDCDPEAVQATLDDTADWQLDLDVDRLAFALMQTVGAVAREVRRRPQSAKLLDRLERLIDLALSVPWTVELVDVQRTFFEVLHDAYPRLVERGDAEATTKAEQMRRMAGDLAVRVPEVE